MRDEPDERATRSFSFGPFVLYPERQLLLCGERRISMGQRALALLTVLVERPGQLIDKHELLSRVWPDTTVEANNIKVHVAALRRALSDTSGQALYIATVSGRGYRFVAQVAPGPASQPSPSTIKAFEAQPLPAAIAHLFGRTEVLTELRRVLAEERLVSIVGDGGIGKTTLAVTVAHAISRDHADGSMFVDLGTIGDPQLLPAAIAMAAGVGMPSVDPLETVVHALRGKGKVVLFDNCEHLLPFIAGTVEHLARHLPDLRILATSREPLRIRGERVVRLAGLACDPRERPTASAALTFPAVALFAARAAERAGFALTDDDAPAVVEICRRLDGNALAIELAATQTGPLSPAQILTMMDDRFRLLSLGPVGAPLRQQSLSATLDWSYALLSEREAALLRAVSVFARSFDVSGAAVVSHIPISEVFDALAQLAAKSLLAMESHGDSVSFRLLETTRSYAAERLSQSPESDAVWQRHATHVCAILERAAREWTNTPSAAWGAAYLHVIDDLQSALLWAERANGERSLLIRLTVAGLRLWNHFSLTRSCLVRVKRALQEIDAAQLTDSATEMTLQLAFASATIFTEGLDPAVLVALQRTLAIATRLGDTDHRLRSLRMIASYLKFVADPHAALVVLDTFLAGAAADDPSATPDCAAHIGLAEILVGRLEDSRRRLEHVYRHDLHTPNDVRFARFLFDRNVDVGNVLTKVQWLLGSPDTALRTARETLARALATEHHLSLSNALAVAVCPVLFLTGRHEDASVHVASLEEVVARQGLAIWRPLARFYRAALRCAEADHLGDGIVLLERSIADFEAIRHLVRLPFYLSVLASALLRNDRLAEARRAIDKARAPGNARDERWCLPEVLRVHAAVQRAEGHADDAEATLREAIAIADELHALSWKLRAATDLAELARSQGRRRAACDVLRPVFQAFSEGFTTQDLERAAALLAALDQADETTTSA